MPAVLRNKKLIAITGGIGSGKSTISRFWASHCGLPLIDLDAICARLLEKGAPGWQQLFDHLDPAFFDENDELKRRKLRKAIFASQGLRDEVNSYIHPLAEKEMIRGADDTDAETVLFEVPLLFEVGWQDRFHHRVLVYSDQQSCCRRIVERDSILPEEVKRTIESQYPLAEKVFLADHVINNSGTLVAAMLEVIHLHRLII